jgi:uncharacterized protein (TIGR01319 family)
MLVDLLVAEIGSTVTKVHAFDRIETAGPLWLGGGAAPTSVAGGDVTIGLRAAMTALGQVLGRPVEGRRMLAASSAAGGLRMSVHGLVRDMTVRAAREAALGAGAVLVSVTSGAMTSSDEENLGRKRPGVILLAGGVEGGDRAIIVGNARAIVASGVAAPVIYAGNSDARAEAVAILEGGGLKVRAVPNVYPRLDQLDIEPTRRAIQEVFEEHIVTAPGMERVRDLVGGTIWPTPGAVMESAAALREILGDLVVVDVGGATTDVHSVTQGSAEIMRLQIQPEPVAKRTVEGDLGVYVNAANVVRLAGEEEVAAYMTELAGSRATAQATTFDSAAVRDILAGLHPLAPEDTEPEASVFVEALARIAAETAIVRHVGRLRHLFGPTGRITVAEGKDLTEVECLIGTGGPLTRFPRALATLSKLATLTPAVVEARTRRAEGGAGLAALSAGASGYHLLPGRGVRPVLDKNYLLAVLGVLHHEYPEAAVSLLRDDFGR